MTSTIRCLRLSSQWLNSWPDHFLPLWFGFHRYVVVSCPTRRCTRCSSPWPSSSAVIYSRLFLFWRQIRYSRACSLAILFKAGFPLRLLWSRALRSLSSYRFFAPGSAPALHQAERRGMCSVSRPRGSDGHRRDYSQLEQGLAALVLVVVAAHLAGELLDRAATGQAVGLICAPPEFSLSHKNRLVSSLRGGIVDIPERSFRHQLLQLSAGVGG